MFPIHDERLQQNAAATLWDKVALLNNGALDAPRNNQNGEEEARHSIHGKQVGL